ncbi:Wax ester synthase/acyl-CoA:diacylglycerol acyltransferase [Patulibacter medicamentivorans]|uniref:Diacylglycerol O-acyltransferase n=1 Tax=Patulibacter medicamentivorans TaxID=1097667 RepID=H0E9W7_9ACTN|nr:wax ester/triacylglycerol synthase family O-acyltransferase [Patulibacter medicamentivorans]EHN09527.1 Wax ester synthase/acyl-CoA:diacylglycerol acyltransferase [Patulibacter medicamentivorans]
MAQQNSDRLTAVDAGFLHQEGPAAHMHIGGLTVFEGPPPPFEEILDQVRCRLHLLPRYRQRLARPPLQSGNPVWIDDPAFNLEYHVRRTALPAPGKRAQLREATAQIFSQRLDRSKPLWELWIVEGIETDRWALISKTHHALIDGISGIDIATALLDVTPEGMDVPHPDAAWQPRPVPTPAEMLATGIVGAARAGVLGATKALEAFARPRAAAGRVREIGEGVGEMAWELMNPAPDTPLNVPIGPHRRYRAVEGRLETFRRIKDHFGGTVNDVVLAVVTSALRDWLQSRGARTEGLELRALVPVSVRSTDERGQLGNRLTAMRGPLPVYIDDPVQRMEVIRRAMRGLKESKQALGAETIANVQNFAPPTVLAQASRLNFSTRLFNVLVTNVPGPQIPLYLRGRKMERAFPVAFLPKDHALAIAILSYDGAINFGLIGDHDALPDLKFIADGIASAIDELDDLARAGVGGATPARVRTAAP